MATDGSVASITRAMRRTLSDRRLAALALTPEVASRQKTGFVLPIGSWMREGVREQCEAAIAAVEQLPFLDGGEVRRVWDGFQGKRETMHWSRPLALVVLGAYLAPA